MLRVVSRNIKRSLRVLEGLQPPGPSELSAPDMVHWWTGGAALGMSTGAAARSGKRPMVS
eukprot:5070989-Alexandrium_andersonii.AAC.1